VPSPATGNTALRMGRPFALFIDTTSLSDC
jgi:hypothetical protein